MPGTSLVTSRTGTLGNWSTNAPDENDRSEDAKGYWPVTRLRTQYIDYLAAKSLEYEEQRVARHYYHAAQWTPEEIRVLRARKQPIVTFNRTARKIDGIVGLLKRLRQDPKAYPRNPKDADGAEIATQCVRYVCDANKWKTLKSRCARQAGIEGIAGVKFELEEGDHGDPDLRMGFVFGDDWFYDPRSYDPDFGDARWHGIAKWLDVETAIELFPEREDELRSLMVETGFDLTTHADREFKWVYTNEQRVRLVEHWYKHDNKWYWAFYCSFIELAQGVSPFVDERGQSMSPFVMFSAAVDHDGDRYGFVRNLKGPQDEMNQRRSKALHISNSRRLLMEKGSVDDVETARREWSRPDGLIEVNPGRKVEPDDRQEDLASQLQLMQDARTEIDSFANINPALLNQDENDEHSGVAINLMQKAGIAELGSFIEAWEDWVLRVYRMIWNIVSREWRAERFLRVTDDQGLVQFLQLNAQRVNEYGQPIIVNAVGSLDVELILEEGPAEETLSLDSLHTLQNLGPQFAQQFPELAIELSPLQGSVKKQMLDKIKAARAQPQQPDPKIALEQAKLQNEQQMEQMRLVAEQQRHNDQMRFEREKAAFSMENERVKAEELLKEKRMQIALDIWGEQQKMAMRRQESEHKMELDRQKAQTQAAAVKQRTRQSAKRKAA